MSDVINKTEMIQVALRVSILSIATYLAVKWMMKQLDPTNSQKKKAASKAQQMLGRLGLSHRKDLTEYEMMIASHLVDPSEISVSWDSIGGLSNIIQDMKETVILPIKRKDLFGDSNLTQPPKGVLLHGPPGCGKTMIAKATAKEAGCHFINLDVSILTDKWYGESQKLASAVFTLAVKIQPCIIFIDEIDSFLRNRNIQDHEATAMMKAQFMTLWDGLNTDSSCTVIVMGATNRPHDLDKAILRRMPASFHVPLPSLVQRKDILKLIMRGEPLAGDVDLDKVAAGAEGMSGSDLKEMCRHASMYRVREYMKNNPAKGDEPDGDSMSWTVPPEKPSNSKGSGDTSAKQEAEEKLRPISQLDLKKSLDKMRESKVKTATFSD